MLGIVVVGLPPRSGTVPGALSPERSTHLAAASPHPFSFRQTEPPQQCTDLLSGMRRRLGTRDPGTVYTPASRVLNSCVLGKVPTRDPVGARLRRTVRGLGASLRL